MLTTGLPNISGMEKFQSMSIPSKIVRKGNYVFPVFSLATGNEDIYESTLDLAIEGIRDTYLNRCYYREVNDSLFENTFADQKLDKQQWLERITYLRRNIQVHIRRISRATVFDRNSPIEFHMSSESYAAHLTMVDDRQLGSGVVCHMYLADNNDNIVQIGIFNIVPDGTSLGLGEGALPEYAGRTIFFMSKKYKDAEQCARNHQDVCKFGIMGSFEMYILDQMLGKIIGALQLSDTMDMSHRYTPIELWMFKTVMTDLNSPGELHTIFTWCHEEDMNDVVTSHVLLDELPEAVHPGAKVNCPKVDFDSKEWKFISAYCRKNNLLQEQPTDLSVYFSHPLYGDVYSINMMTVSGKEIPLIVTYTMDAEQKKLRLYIVENIRDDMNVMVVTDFVDIDHYVPDKSTRLMKKLVFYTKYDNLHASVSDIMNDSSILQAGIDNTSSLVGEILRFFVIMHDRPERTRMVQGIKHHTTVIKTKHGKKVKNETTEVVWRILKPAKAAKEYISQMNGASRNMEYSLEEWDRVGHWRTLKSGKSIWIESTTCHRRDDLLTKEKDIKIKL